MYQHVFKVCLGSTIEEQVWTLVKEVFEYILREIVPLYLQTDNVIEFKSILFQGQLAKYKLKFYTLKNDTIKAAIVERFNRTLKKLNV